MTRRRRLRSRDGERSKVFIASLKPCPAGASMLLFGIFDLFVDDVARVAGALAELVLQAADATPGVSEGTMNAGDALVALLRIERGEDRVPGRDRRRS